MADMKANRPIAVALLSALLTLVVAYFASYAVLVERTATPGIYSLGEWHYYYAPTYRCGDAAPIHRLYAPAFQIDYWLRPGYWDEEIMTVPPNS
jgi:hypothetical protein